MNQTLLGKIKIGWTLLRFISVATSSVTTVISTMLPLFLYSHISSSRLFVIFIVLIVGGILIHGGLTHLLNDHADHLSGTDQNSPAILSGGSRLIQTNMITPATLWRLGKFLLFFVGVGIVLLMLFGFYKIAILLGIGMWSAWSYSLPPFQLSYKPFIGEWLSMFPAVLMLGLGGAWLTLGTIPEWALQNAVINALFCNAWVMVHHIPDRQADKAAIPMKRTSVVWAVAKFGESFAGLPALLYFFMIAGCAFWLGTERVVAAAGTLVISCIAIGLVLNMRIKNDAQVSAYEKILLLLAIITGVWIGLFPG